MPINIAKKIKNIRDAEQLTQEDLANLVDITSKRSIGAYERGEIEPGFEAIQKICNAFPQYMEYLMLDEMREPRTPGQITPQEKTHLDSNSQGCHRLPTLLSEKIKEIRLAEGFNQRLFSEYCGLIYGTYRNYESNIRQPDVVAIQKICNAFPQYMEYLMFNEMREPRTPGQITPQEKIHLD